MNSGCRQTSNPAWLDPKGPAANKLDLAKQVEMYKNIHISTADKTVLNAVNHEQNKDKMCINRFNT